MLGENKSGRALLIIDMINDHAHPNGDNYLATSHDMINYVTGELAYFRERMRPVLFCHTLPENNPMNTPEHELFRGQVIQTLSPRAQELSITKTRANAFFNTDLAQILRDLKVKTITLVGTHTHTSIINTAASALDHGFEVVVPETCVCDLHDNLHLAALRLIQNWITHD